MASSNDPYRSYYTAASVLSLTTMGIASLVLIGWTFGIPTLTSLVPGLVSMKVTTAFGFLCAATSVLLVLNGSKLENRIPRLSAQTLAALPASAAALLGLGTLVGYAVGVEVQTTHPAWMAPSTAASFVLFALAVLTFQSEKKSVRQFSESAVLVMVGISGFALVGYLYNAPSLYTFKPYASMALHTTLSFLSIGLALLCVRPDRGVMAIVLSREVGGLMLRRMIPLTLGMVVVTGWVRLVGETTGWFDRSLSLRAVIGLSMGGFCIVLWIVARAVNRAAKERDDSRIRLQLAKEAAGLGIQDYDITQGTIQWDERVRELWGVEPEEPITIQTFWAGVHPDDQALTKSAWDRALDPSGDGRYGIEFRVVHRTDGRTRWIEATGRVTFERGVAVRLVGSVQDIAERKEAEEALRASEARFRTMAEAAPVGIFRTDESGNCVYVNEWWRRIVGMTSEDALGQGWAERLHPDDRSMVFDSWMSAVEHHRAFSAEYRFVNPSGHATWVLGHAVPEAGGGYIGITMDITERKQAEEALADQKRLYQTVTDNASVALFIMDERQHCVFMNPAAQQLTGYSLAEAQGRPLHEVIHHTRPDGRPYPLSECPIDQAFPEENRMQGEDVFVHRDGRFYHVAFTASPLLDETNTPVGTIIEVQDITERKRGEVALRKAQERLQRWNQELEQAVTVKTAELTQSEERLRALASELNLAEQRERKRLATELHDHLQQMLVLGKLEIGRGKRIAVGVPACETALKRVDDILSDALTYSRTLVAELSPTVLRDHGLAAGLKWLAEYMKKHDQTVTVIVPDNQGLQLPEDQVMLLFQSVRELLINASKHAGTDEATVTMEQHDGNLSITVSDKGNGFDLAAAAAAAAETPSGGISSKFGLFSIGERMRALGGSFTIQSAPGQGTTARLTLPLGGGPAAECSMLNDECSIERKEIPTGGGESAHSTLKIKHSTLQQYTNPVRVLLVDDHAMVRQGVRSVLDAYDDIQVVGDAQDGQEAVRLVGELQPQVVVMDINMPKMNGIEATARIKTQWPETIVVGISVNTGDANGEAMRRAGAAVLLNKDAAVDDLYRTIQDVLIRTE